jgi:hypothetical protein
VLSLYQQTSLSLTHTHCRSYDQLQSIVNLASQSLPERPDGIVCVAKFTSVAASALRNDDGSRLVTSAEAEYERMARQNPATIFLRCIRERATTTTSTQSGASSLVWDQANIVVCPTFDVFYGGHRVARVEGNEYNQLQQVLDLYQMQNSKLDLFSEDANASRQRLMWGNGRMPKMSSTNIPQTTNRFIPGYDWNNDRGILDDLSNQFQDDFDDFETTFGEWTPNIDD